MVGIGLMALMVLIGTDNGSLQEDVTCVRLMTA